MNCDFRDDQDLQRRFRKLPQHAPRPGYEQRFWARAETPEAPIPLRLGAFGRWRWLPVAATALGLVAGLAAANFSRPQPVTTAVSAVGTLPEGSLAATFAFKAGE